MSQSYYEILEVAPKSDLSEIRSRYRDLARLLHPDRRSGGIGDGQEAEKIANEQMALINEAWTVLSSSNLRAAYDSSLQQGHRFSREQFARQPDVNSNEDNRTPPLNVRNQFNRSASPKTRQRSVEWTAGFQAQIARLSRLSGRSSLQMALLKNPHGSRSDYEAVLEELIEELVSDTVSRLRAARAAGATPLDLGVATTLVGVRIASDRLRRKCSDGVTKSDAMTAQLLDRMWDVLAHELPMTLTVALGGRPSVSKRISWISKRSDF